MRIAVWHELGPGGGLRALVQQVEGLVERGHTVEVFAPPWADGHPSFVQPVEQHAVDAAPVRSRIGPFWLTPPHRAAQLEASRAAAAEITGDRFDVLLAHPSGLSAVPPIGRFIRVPTVLYLQEPNRRLYEPEPVLPWLPTPIEGAARFARDLPRRTRDIARLFRARRAGSLEQADARTYDGILVNSYFSRESLLRAYGLDAEVCYLGVDTATFRPLGLDREPFVIGVGRIQPRKRVELAIDAVAGIPPSRRPELRWYGDGADEAYLSRLSSLAHERRVNFNAHRAVSDGELIEALNRATAMVYGPRLEPFGYAPLEAGACELPVAAVPEGGIRETVIDGVNGVLAEPHSLPGAIDDLLRDASAQRELGTAGRALVLERWTSAAATSRLEEALSRLLQRHPVRIPTGTAAPRRCGGEGDGST